MSSQNIEKKQNILKILCKESTLLHAIAIITLTVGAIFLDYVVTMWEIKVFRLEGEWKIIILYMLLNAMVAFIAYIILVFLLNWLKGGISQMFALIHYCYLPLTENEVRERFTSAESYIRHIENKLEYKKYYFDYEQTCYKTITEDDIRKILQVCCKVFGSSSIFSGICNNRREPDDAGHDWFIREHYDVVDGIGFIYENSKKIREFTCFMRKYLDFKDENQSFNETTIINEEGTVTLSYSYKFGKKMNKIGVCSITF